MNRHRNELIAELSGDLTATGRAGHTRDLVVYWLGFNFAIALFLTYSTGSFREGSLQQAFDHPQFMLESLTGLLAIVLLCVTALRSAIPANVHRLKHFAPALALLFIWLMFYVAGLWLPALEPSTAGMRTYPCYLETLAYGIPSLLLGMYINWRLWPLHGAMTGLMTGLAAGATPALIMQFACMYVPVHIITHHLLPGLLLGVAGAVAGRFLLSR